MKIVYMLLMVGLVAVPVLADDVDDFEGYSLGDPVAPWTTSEAAWYSSIADDGGNQVMTWGGTNTVGSGGDYRDNRRPTPLSISNQGTLSFDLKALIEEVDNAVGLTHNEGMTWYSDYGPYMRLISDGDIENGLVELSVRDGDGFVDDLAYLNIGQWYNIELLDIDVAGGDDGDGGFDLYLDGDLVYSSADFRYDYVEPLDVLCLMGAGNNNDRGVAIDNIVMTPEPGTLALLGLGGLIGLRRRK